MMEDCRNASDAPAVPQAMMAYNMYIPENAQRKRFSPCQNNLLGQRFGNDIGTLTVKAQIEENGSETHVGMRGTHRGILRPGRSRW